MRIDRTVLLGDVCKFVGGGTPSRKQPEYFEGNIPWATVKDFKTFLISDTEEHISDVAIADSATNIVSPGTVLLVTRVGLGKVAIAGCRLAINQDIKAITPTDDVLPEFLFWFLLSKANDIQRMGAGATVKGVTLNDIKSITMPLPSISEQRRIVDILSRAEGVIRLRREAEKKAAELIPALFLDMFGDPATNPKGWPIALLSTLCDKCTTTDPRKTPQTGFTYIDIAAVDNDRGSIVEPKPVLGADAPSRARQVVKAGDVIVSTVRPNLRGSAMVSDALDGQICSTGFCVLRPNVTATSAFIFALARSNWFVDEMMKKVRGAQYPAVTDKDLFGHPVPVPPLSLQQGFADRFAETVSIQNQQSTATSKAQATFDALLAQAFSS